ncbi:MULTISPECIES: ribose-phosphate pyrophosphokinase [Bradyrhizobium]|jgi:ribose-phosphate pyrophosphokinase|nr:MULTISPECIES: ribose-phosphate pyrophosphokinase [Bradyrhizobium]MDU0955266.1 ribose-phosphate pyrophosphokinase [Bradyrhizobium sp.]MDU1495665.1 ribose-phosphate pyrophosphokinase [Bradyrhizobium sp.]MDU1545831.1 ribose-phosphate pyrophosphokinase [Bradyrhizobium sp.]MDU1667883.1 ribose-phosphate pyrophosphokinase [Bradyrhizobium sp.]MDU1690412.1 ribose-phosphate pyrophosphokinase [Bradyrhizobium sp.]
MTPTLLFSMPGNERLTTELADQLDCETGKLNTRQFPDGETYLRFATDLNKRSVAIVCTLAHPDEKILPLIFAAATARELGASKVGLVAPYLAYMRQDRRFNAGEAVTSRQVARLISEAFDWMVTIDPHLHRYGDLSEIYSIPTRVVHAAPLISKWVKANIEKPLIIGPDSESEQWVAAVASDAAAPYCVLEKVRHGDRDVRITLRNLEAWQGRTAVLVDDIISSGRTMIEAVRLLAGQGWPPPVCIAVHGLFADHSDELLVGAGARVVTTNSVGTGRSEIDIGPLLGDAIKAIESVQPRL